MARTKQTARQSTGGAAPRRPFHEPTSAVADAWAITEIAEKILARLPMKDLLLAQTVCTSWREAIRTSPLLQELLFMRPRQPEADQTSDGTPIRELNPLLIQHMPLWFPLDEDKWRQSVKDTPWAQTSSRLAFLSRADASWRKMLLAQPPYTIFEAVEQVHAMGGDSLRVGQVKQPDGVRMGLAYDKAVEAVEGGYGRLPNHFYAVMDGRVTCNAGGAVTDGPGGQATSERIFGGIDKFTLFSSSTRGCMMPTYEASRSMRMEQRQLTSAGEEEVTIKLHQVTRGGGGHGWWTKDGHRKP